MDLRDSRTWLYLGMVTAGEAEVARLEVLQLHHARALSLWTGDLDAFGRQRLGDVTDRAEQAIEALLLPWAAPRATSADELRALEAKWAEAWGGSMDDPAMRARIEEACRRLQPVKKSRLRR